MRQLIVITNFYPIWPVIHGGQRRIFYLARELSAQYNVRLVTLSRDTQFQHLRLGEHLEELQIPAEDAYRRAEAEVEQRAKMAGDVAYALHWSKCDLYQNVLTHALREASAVITAQPYSFYAIQAALGSTRKPIVFDSQNVERRQKREVLADYSEGYQAVIDIERQCLVHSDRVLACSDVDIVGYGEDYGVPADRIVLIPNGVDLRNVPQLSTAQRSRYREETGLHDHFTCVFAGSFHFPNLRGADRIIEMAAQAADCLYIIFGSVAAYLHHKTHIPDNVRVLGTLGESEKWLLLALCDLGLNPIEYGSGSNIKMFEYAAAKLPVLSTEFGARGTTLHPDEDFILSEIDSFHTHINLLRNTGAEDLRHVGDTAYRKVAANNDWSTIGAKYSRIMGEILAC